MKKELKEDKNDWAENVAEEVQTMQSRATYSAKTVYDALRELSNKKRKAMYMVKRKGNKNDVDKTR